MVTPGRSRPASLTQRQVDDLSRGGPGDAAPLLRAAHRAPGAETRPAPAGAPVPLSAKEMQAIVRGGTAPVRIGQRIVAATPVAKKTTRGKVKPEPARRPSGSAPSLRPPGSGESR